MLTSAFGASIAHSMATANGCDGTSSGNTSTGVWHCRTKSRVTVKTKSAFVRNILVTNFSTVSVVMSGRRLTSSAPQPVMLASYMTLGISGRNPTGCAGTAAATPSRRPLNQVPDELAADAEAKHHELVDAEMIHQADMVVGVRIPR